MRIFRKFHISTISSGQVSTSGDGNTLAVVNVNTAVASAVLTLYDGTANTDPVVAVIDCATPSSKVYLVHFNTGIYYALAGGAADITISYE